MYNSDDLFIKFTVLNATGMLLCVSLYLFSQYFHFEPIAGKIHFVMLIGLLFIVLIRSLFFAVLLSIAPGLDFILLVIALLDIWVLLLVSFFLLQNNGIDILNARTL